MIVLALVGLAPGVATFKAWLYIALLAQHSQSELLQGWLVPAPILNVLGAQGVLVGAGVVTILIGCLGLTNIYIASLERRLSGFGLMMSLGGSRNLLTALLLLEAFAIGFIGSIFGLLLGEILMRLVRPAAADYLRFANDLNATLEGTWRFWGMVQVAPFLLGILAALLFMGLISILTTHFDPSALLRREVNALLSRWRQLGTTIYGALLTGALSFVAGIAIDLRIALALAALAAILGALLSLVGWTLTNFYHHLPLLRSAPLWNLAVQGLARHPSQTVGLVLAMITGSYAVGMAALAWMESQVSAIFPFWVAGAVLFAGASLVLTTASLAAIERRQEFAMLLALGARTRQIWGLVLLEYAIIASGSGLIGALAALSNWLIASRTGSVGTAIGMLALDLCGALISAWMGAAPVLWRVSQRDVGRAIRER